MDKIQGKLTVYFETPFWVGIFEKVENGKLSASKVIFSAEPKDGEIYEFILRQANKLQYSPAVETVVKQEKKNPKRIQRELRKHSKTKGVSTKSQEALRLQQEQFKLAKKKKRKKLKQEQAEEKFKLKQKKKKEKHRGK